MSKRLLFIALAMIVFQGFISAQVNTDSLIGALQAEIQQLKPPPAMAISDTCQNCLVDTTDEFGYVFYKDGKIVYSPKTLGFFQGFLVILPVLLFGFILIYVLRRLKKENYSLSEMLSDNQPSEIDVPNPNTISAAGAPIPNEPAFVKKSVLVRSTSRMAAFISSICAVAIGTCSTSYYFLLYLKTGQAPNLDSLYNILLGLGIGVVPYAANKIAAAFKD